MLRDFSIERLYGRSLYNAERLPISVYSIETNVRIGFFEKFAPREGLKKITRLDVTSPILYCVFAFFFLLAFYRFRYFLLKCFQRSVPKDDE